VLVAIPLSHYYLDHPQDFWTRIDQVREQEGGGTVTQDPVSIARAYLVTLRSFVWDGFQSSNVNLPGRPILDPILAVWALAGFAIALRHPLHRLHGVALLWFLLFVLPSALSSPGHPSRALAATPAVFLFPLLAMNRTVAVARERWPRRRGVLVGAVGIIALSIVGSAAWSLHDYFRIWAPSDKAYVAFQGDVRDSLAAMQRLPDDGEPVYYSTWTLERLVTYLAPDHPRRDIDGRSMLVLPGDGGGYLVYPTVTAPHPDLLRFAIGVDDSRPHAIGHSPIGGIAWQVWRLDTRRVEAVSSSASIVEYPGNIELIGVEGPANAGEPAGNDPVAVMLVWRVESGSPSRIARVRFALSTAVGTESSSDVTLPAGSTVVLDASDHAIVITRVELPSPPPGDAAIDLELALFEADPNGPPLDPVESEVSVLDGYARVLQIPSLPAP
jgi:hypothetical protein